MIPAAGVGDEHHFALAVAVEVFAGVILVKNHAEPGGAEYNLSARVVDRPSALVAISALAVAHRAQRNLVTVPKFFRVWLVLR